jgi:hypothetical protein
MSNVLDEEKQQQIRGLGRLGWTLSRIQDATGIRRETISGYLKAAGIVVRSRGRPSDARPKPAIAPVDPLTAFIDEDCPGCQRMSLNPNCI